MILEHFGFDMDTRLLTKNGYRDRSEAQGEHEPQKLQKKEESGFRAIAARANNMAIDVPNAQLPTKDVCRDKSKPSVAAYERVKRLARYLASFEEVWFEYVWQSGDEALSLRGFTDSDWAGCQKTRKSTSGGAIFLGKHCLRTWSSTQPVRAQRRPSIIPS